MSKAVVIVDAYNTGMKLAEAFIESCHAKGIKVIHVQSNPTPIKGMSPPRYEAFDARLDYTGDIEQLAQSLQDYEIIAAVPGQEPGVELADTLSEYLRLPNTNGTAKSSARRNKYDMIEAVAEARVPTPLFLKSQNLEEIRQWVKTNTFYPVVVKALRSAGNDGVHICKTEKELIDSVNNIMTSNTLFGEPNSEVLVESFLDGLEYVVNSVSKDGEHVPVEVMYYLKERIGTKTVYDRIVLVPLNSPEAQELIAYNNQVLDALGIKNGPTHSEIMMTKDGPRLVETGARISGMANREFFDACCGVNQIDLTVASYCDAARFQELKSKINPELQQPGIIVDVIYRGAAGRVERVDTAVEEQIRRLGSAQTVIIKRKPGDELVPTETLAQSPAKVFLTHQSAEVIKQDYAELNRLVHKLFRVIPTNVLSNGLTSFDPTAARDAYMHNSGQEAERPTSFF